MGNSFTLAVAAPEDQFCGKEDFYTAQQPGGHTSSEVSYVPGAAYQKCQFCLNFSFLVLRLSLSVGASV